MKRDRIQALIAQLLVAAAQAVIAASPLGSGGRRSLRSIRRPGRHCLCVVDACQPKRHRSQRPGRAGPGATPGVQPGAGRRCLARCAQARLGGVRLRAALERCAAMPQSTLPHGRGTHERSQDFHRHHGGVCPHAARLHPCATGREDAADCACFRHHPPHRDDDVPAVDPPEVTQAVHERSGEGIDRPEHSAALLLQADEVIE